MALVVESISTNDWTAESTTTLTKPTGVADGELLIAILAEEDSASATINSVPSGWTLANSVTGSNSNTLYAYWKIASSEGSSWDWGWTSGTQPKAGIVLRISGNTSTPIDASDFGSIGNANSGSFTGGAGTLTPTYSNSLLVMAVLAVQGSASHSTYAIATNNPTWTKQTQLDSASSDGLSVATASRPETTATGAFSASFGSGGTADAVAILIVVTARVDTTGTHSLLSGSPTIFATSGKAGTTGTCALLSSTPTIFTPAASETSPSSAWINDTAPSTTWINDQLP